LLELHVARDGLAVLGQGVGAACTQQEKNQAGFDEIAAADKSEKITGNALDFVFKGLQGVEFSVDEVEKPMRVFARANYCGVWRNSFFHGNSHSPLKFLWVDDGAIYNQCGII
jgi:hypothetical protein